MTRIRDRELAWYAFSTLDQLDAVLYVQQFVPPGGVDTRMLVIGEEVIGVRRNNSNGFRTNVSGGAQTGLAKLTQQQVAMARHITGSIGLAFASVDVIDSADGIPRVLEVNGIPGWRGAQSAVDFSIAERIVRLMIAESQRSVRHA